ncbi:MAG: S-layer homology domain-containing protein [bacterium]
MRMFWLAFFLLISTPVMADIKITSLLPNSETYNDVLVLNGVNVQGKTITINEASVPLEEGGAFSCALILNPGKNLIEIKGDKEKKYLKVLKLISYPDVQKTTEGKKHWAAKEIAALSTLGIIEGSQDGNFYPGKPITRGEFATWLARAKQLPIKKVTADVFFDVPKEHWRAPYVKAVVLAGYITPFPNKLFGVEDPISRSEAAEISARIEGGGMKAKTTKIFRDVDVLEGGVQPIYAAQNQGSVQGVSKNATVLDPERALTRAEAAVIVSRLKKVQEDITALFNYKKEYTRLCGINIKPTIKSLKIEPNPIDLGTTTNIRLIVELAPRGKFAPIIGVKADLSSLGGPTEAIMEKNNNVYYFDYSFQPKESGEKKLGVTAVDRLGWESKREAMLLTVE